MSKSIIFHIDVNSAFLSWEAVFRLVHKGGRTDLRKIHVMGGCPATGTGKNAMKNPIYFGTYEEAESYSVQIAPGEEKRKCGNCW